MIDFFAKWPHYVDHMLPIYKQLGDVAGDFMVPTTLESYLWLKHIEPKTLKANMQGSPMNVSPVGDNPILVAAHGDLQQCLISSPKRPVILMEHGVGLVFPGNASYAGNSGTRRRAALTLAPNQIVFHLTQKALPGVKQYIIGTPKLDKWYNFPFFQEEDWLNPSPYGRIPVVAISFHWDGSAVAPEAGTAFRHYQPILKTLSQQRRFKLIAHGHPRSLAQVKPVYEHLGIDFIDDFDEVMVKADLLINDCSSIMYEWCITGKPVIILNAPWFRKNVNFGIRFWRFTDIGLQIEHPDALLAAIEWTLAHPGEHNEARKRAAEELFPHFGNSAKIAAVILKEAYG